MQLDTTKTDGFKTLRSLGWGTLGFGVAAICGGGWLVKTYDWDTEWTIAAPVAVVYAAMTTPEEQFKWWPSMRVAKIAPIAGYPKGRIITYHVKQAASVARFTPPFVIHAKTMDIEEERRTRSVVTGDLCGVLETLFYSQPNNTTRVRFHWYVRVRNPLLNILGFVREPLFRASHDKVMREGELGLREYIGRT